MTSAGILSLNVVVEHSVSSVRFVSLASAFYSKYNVSEEMYLRSNDSFGESPVSRLDYTPPHVSARSGLPLIL